MSDLTDQTIVATVRALLSKEYSFEMFLTDRASGCKERIRQQIKNKKRYELQKAQRALLRQKKAEEQNSCVHTEEK